jgi:type 1 glutamine amidotransferase
MIGLTGQRNAAFGERIYYDDGGKQVRLAKGEGPTYPRPGHGPDHVFTVTVRDKEHPIMKGMPERWQHARDQLYHGLRGPARNMTILATAFSAKDKRGTGFHEPIVWTVSLGKSRVAVTTLGNDVTGITASGAAAVLCRAAEWTATGEVTISAPRDLPLADAPAGKTATTERAR